MSNLARAEPWVQAALRRNDIALAVLLAMIVAMIILPMPTFLVDAMIALSMAMAVVLLMVAVYIPSPIAFSTFPSVLLLTTLFRLALSITTTRLILLHADAGEIVSAFGEFVVGGNVIVGLVIFLIITVVQFIVVTKGAERVAEVSARFSLDSLPGKQMSIDGDMRAGVIDMDQARQRRRRLEKESQLYGSLDGAMKFVKGDAIAGIFIALINLVGGISVGMLQHDMAFNEAVGVFTILTVGDGLVAQIPALIISVTAGIVVTRVTGQEGANLGEDIGRQILAQPRALLVSAVLLFALALVPGFPEPVFVALGVLLGLVGLVLQLVARRQQSDEGAFLNALSANAERQEEGGSATRDLPRASPVLVTLDARLQPLLDHRSLNAEFARIRKRLFMDLGVPAAGVQLRYEDGREENEYRISVHEVPVGGGCIKPEHLLARASLANLHRLGITRTEKAVMPVVADEYHWVPQSHHGELIGAGIHCLSSNQVLAQHLAAVLDRNASELVGVQETRQLLDGLIPDSADLTKEANASIPLPVLAETLKRLLAEGVPIRNLSIILETVLKWIPESKEAGLLSEKCRKALRRQISHRFSRDGVIDAVLLDPDAEEVARNVHPGTVDMATRQRLHERMVSTLAEARAEYPAVVLLLSPEFRQPMREFIRRDHPMTPVLCFDDLSDEVQIRSVARVSMAERVAASG